MAYRRPRGRQAKGIGRSHLLIAAAVSDGVNFSVSAWGADRVQLLLFEEPDSP